MLKKMWYNDGVKKQQHFKLKNKESFMSTNLESKEAIQLITYLNTLIKAYIFYQAKRTSLYEKTNYNYPFSKLRKALTNNQYKNNKYAIAIVEEYLSHWIEMFGYGVDDNQLIELVKVVIKNTN